MTREQIRAARDHIRRENRDFPKDRMAEVPKSKWPSDNVASRIAAFRSHDFLAQVFDEGKGLVRLSVSRTDIDRNGMWLDGITWDQLQWCKTQCG